MIFHRDNYEDIRKYYNHTIIKLPELSDDRLWQILSITPDEVKLQDVDGMEIYMDLNDPYTVEYPLPSRTVYQHQDRAALLTRKPAKQYYRGLHKDNTQLAFYRNDGVLSLIGWDIGVLQQFVDKPAYQDIYTINLEEGYSWALSRHMAVARTGNIMVLNKCVGIANFTEKTVLMQNQLFKPEVKEVFPGYTLV